MKKNCFYIILGIACSIFFVSPFISHVYANIPSSSFFVSGKVNDTNGKNLKNANVEITCNGETKQAKTNLYGRYTVIFSRNNCKNNNTVSVFAYDGHQNGYSQEVVKPSENSDVDVSCSNSPVSVPEFGVLEGFIAAVISFSLFLLLKKGYFLRS